MVIKMITGNIDIERTMDDGDIAYWYCPFCGAEHKMELDAVGEVECWECGKEFMVKDIFSLYW